MGSPEMTVQLYLGSSSSGKIQDRLASIPSALLDNLPKAFLCSAPKCVAGPLAALTLLVVPAQRPGHPVSSSSRLVVQCQQYDSIDLNSSLNDTIWNKY